MRYKLALLLIVLSLAARLPFLMSSASFFDSDEAIEGLMARHVLHGELPIFYWGQGYKGVPEVYLAAAVFAIAGSSVVALKSVTLFLFALWVGLNFILLDELFTRRTAFLGSLLLIAGPPALVFWSLSANAEFILTMLSGTLLLLLFQQWEKSHSAKIAILLSFTLGVAWWIHQLIIYYVLPVALILLLRSQWWKRNRSLKLVSDVLLARWIPLLPRLFLCALNIAAVSYSGLYAIAFFTGGFSAHIAAVDISAHNPQKMLRVAIALLGLSICLWIAITHRLKILGLLRKWFWIPIAFIIGYSPAILYSIFKGRIGAPLRQFDFQNLLDALPVIIHDILPILAGFKAPDTSSLHFSPILGLPLVFCLALFFWSAHRQIRDIALLRAKPYSVRDTFYQTYMLLIPVIFLIGGVFLDAQSYRYLVPLYAGISLACVHGIESASAKLKLVAAVLFAFLMMVFTWQQINWYWSLRPDNSWEAMISALRDCDVEGGYADYWISYKMTFLSHEQLIIAPQGNIDRFPPYRRFVQKQHRIAFICRPGETCQRDTSLQPIGIFSFGPLKAEMFDRVSISGQ